MVLSRRSADRSFLRTNLYWGMVETVESDANYTRIVASFVAAGLRSLHRGEDRCRLPVQGTLTKVARELFKALQDYTPKFTMPDPATAKKGSNQLVKLDSPDSLVDKLQEYFFLSVTGFIKSIKDEKFKCPVQVYLACFGYNDDDTFKRPSDVTPHLAAWTYLLRCTALLQAHQAAELKQTESAFE